MNEHCYAARSSMLSVEQALEFLLARALPITEMEDIDTSVACGRILARTLYSPIDVPSADNSAMDGYALAVRDLAVRPASLPVAQRIVAGDAPSTLRTGTAARIFTGAPIPLRRRRRRDARAVQRV